jgi:hypothetical protein
MTSFSDGHSPDGFRASRDVAALLDEPQWTRAQVLELTGLSWRQLKGTVDRNMIRLDNGHNPGTGHPRRFTGRDIIKLMAAHAIAAVGVPMRVLVAFEELILVRAHAWLAGLIPADNSFVIVLYPLPGSDDWAILPQWHPHQPRTPVACAMLDVDKLIHQAFDRFAAVLADEPLPDLCPPPVNEVAEDFAAEWVEDEDGNRVRVGLTLEESEELGRLIDQRFAERTGVDLPTGDRIRRRERLRELRDRHERARFARLFHGGSTAAVDPE